MAVALGWQNPRHLTKWLTERGLWESGSVKPADPKTAMEAALREAGRPRSSAIYRRIARRANFQRCEDGTFLSAQAKLREWFGTD